jgi:phage shock protein PspC (stress-responsive transcriptional regulator)
MSTIDTNARRPFKKVNGSHKWFAGVCGGIAYSFGVPALFVRIGFMVFILCTNRYLDYIGSLVFGAYILMWIFAPRWTVDPDDYDERTS